MGTGFVIGSLVSVFLGQVDVIPPEPTLPPPPTGTSTEGPDLEVPSSMYETVVRGHRPSPAFAQDRLFTSTRFWLLDPGQAEVEVWSRTRFFKDSTGQPTEHLWQAEFMIGAWPHLQLDVYQNINYNVDSDGVRRVTPEGNQIEARIAIPSYYGQIFANPVIYLEWHPQYGGPERAEIRLLLGGEVTDWMILAVNPYFETNVTKTDSPVVVIQNGMPTPALHSEFIADAEAGATIAAGFKITDGLRLSAQAKVGGDMLGSSTNTFHLVAWAGPGLIWKPLPEPYSRLLKIMATCMFGLAGTDLHDPDAGAGQSVEAQFIVGSQF
jgi:hypothetical protein